MTLSQSRQSPRIARVDVGLIIPLRHAVLRQDLPMEASHFPGDAIPSTLHLAALADNRVVGCASYVQNDYDGAPAYQLRGMATDPDWRGRGVGQSVLEYAEILLRDDPIRVRWCNARVVALGFYLKQGWQVVSPEFDIPTAGPHHRMMRRTEPHSERATGR